MQTDLLTPSEWARPETNLLNVSGLVIHWVGNPMTSPKANRDYWETREGTYGSAHYIVGIDGEVMRCLPENEMAYHCGAKEYKPSAIEKFGTYPNNSTIGIETCHLNWQGQYSVKTLRALTDLCVDLSDKYGIEPENIVRHFDITGKDCPRFFVENAGVFEWFRTIVDDRRQCDCRRAKRARDNN